MLWGFARMNQSHLTQMRLSSHVHHQPCKRFWKACYNSRFSSRYADVAPSPLTHGWDESFSNVYNASWHFCSSETLANRTWYDVVCGLSMSLVSKQFGRIGTFLLKSWCFWRDSVFCFDYPSSSSPLDEVGDEGTSGYKAHPLKVASRMKNSIGKALPNISCKF